MTWKWLTAVVLAHLAISFVHGASHARAHVPMSNAANLFVFVVILAGPLLGLGLTWRADRLGGWVIALTMAGSLAFGFVNHFVVIGPDHIGHVAAAERVPFTVTAVLLAITELGGAGLAIRYVHEERIRV